MTNPFITKKGVNRLYRPSVDNLYSNRFYQDFSTGLSIKLSKNDNSRTFFSFEPRGCVAERLLCANNHYDLNRRIEQTIDNAIYSLMLYGKAYIYFQPHYVQQMENEVNVKPANQTISALDIGEIKGAIKKKIGNKYIFYSKGFNGHIITKEFLKEELIIIKIRELGYKKKYFPKLIKKLGKCDVSSPAMMASKNTEGYDFNIHLKKKRLRFLKITKSIGWMFGNDGLSDSYILHRKILQDKFRIKVLKLIVDKINNGLSTCLHNESVGKLTAHVQTLDYDDIWRKYSKGEITVTELTNLLYPNH